MHKKKVNMIWTNVVFICLSAIIGFVCVVLPPYIIPGGIKSHDTAPLFPFVATAIKNFAFYPTMTLLLITGFVLGYYKPKIWWLIGLSAMAIFPLVSSIEMKYSPTSHNLWPFELIEDVINTIPSFIGAFIGSRFGKARLAKRNG